MSILNTYHAARPVGRTNSPRLRHVVAARAMLILWATAMAPAAHAQLFPPVNSQNGFSALRVLGSGSAFAVGFDTFDLTNNPSNTKFGSKGDTLFVGDVASVISPISGVSAFSSFSGDAGFGTLKGTAVAELNGGPTTASTQGTVLFIDVMTILADGHNTRNWNINLQVDGSLSQTVVGPGNGASVKAELWVFNAGAYLNGGFIIPAYHEIIFKDSIGTTQSVVLDNHLERLIPGSTWFVATSLEVRAAVDGPFSFPAGLPNSFLRAESDFSSTVKVFIDASPDTPWASYSTASGFDYRAPVPEPSTLALLGLGGAFLLRRRPWVCRLVVRK